MRSILNRWIVVTGVLTLILGICVVAFRGGSGNVSYYEGDETFPPCLYMELDMLKCDVELIPYDGEDIRLVYSSLVPITVRTGDNRLVVSESSEMKLTFLTQPPQQTGLKLYLPEKEYGGITIYTSSGRIDCSGISAGEIMAVTKTGDISFDGCYALLQLKSGSGDISLQLDEIVQNSSVETRKGDAQICFPRGSSVALSYKTETGSFSSDMIKSDINGSYMFSFGGGEKLLHADVESGTLTVNYK